ncbi:MAG: hypothetical protein F6K17_34005 [Okeania sp. SIO3C4]|nr:hypothetical protein [Okeania sp. SIO3C4]
MVRNGDFEAVDYIGRYTTYNSQTVPNEFGWSISDDFVYLVNSFWSGVSGTTNPDGFDQSLELRPNAILSQTFATQVGQEYELSFWYAHDPHNQQGYAKGSVNLQGNNLLQPTASGWILPPVALPSSMPSSMQAIPSTISPPMVTT